MKIAHLVFISLMFGGIISSIALRLSAPHASLDEVRATYHALTTISDGVIRYGAQGILLTALVYSLWTPWGFAKYRWVLVKWVVFMGQTLFGIFFVDRLMSTNLSLLSAGGTDVLSAPAFLANHRSILIGATIQVGCIVVLLCLSVLKPWRSRVRR